MKKKIKLTKTTKAQERELQKTRWPTTAAQKTKNEVGEFFYNTLKSSAQKSFKQQNYQLKITF